jgi:uroporphyrinogen decarboxylase
MFIWEIMRQSMGDVTLYESLLLDPGWIHDFNRVYTDFFKAHFAYMFEHVGTPDGIWIYEDLGYKNGLFASPKVLGELIFPYYQELVGFFHSYDLPVVLHTCGSTAQALPLIVEAGFDALNPMERKAKDNDPFAFAEEYGERLAFVGGLDARVLETNDKHIIRREMIDYIEGMKARGARLVFASDHSISTNTTYASYRYALDVYREHMTY